MKISYHTAKQSLNPAIGYGYAGGNIVKSLKQLGHEVNVDDKTAKVQLNFCQPDYFKFNKNQYQIGYTPWESTVIKKEWVILFNKCDEVWTTSDWCANVFQENGVKVDIKVFPHGIEDIWSPHRRIVADDRPLKFLHVGEPAPRKGGQMALDAFVKYFAGDERYSLTIKGHYTNSTRVYINDNKISTPNIYNNIKIITDELELSQLVDLYKSHHVLIYPGWGEGFGLIPFQALATGMPTICTEAWAHYKDYLGPLKLNSTLTDDAIPNTIKNIHLGKMFRPDQENLEENMLFVAKNFKAMSGYYYSQSSRLHKDYNWLQLTNNAFEHILKKFS